MIRVQSIRVRLTIWYSSMLFVGTLILGSIMWLGVDSGIRTAMQLRLEDRLEGVMKPLATESGHIRERLRAVVRNPEASATVIPEQADEIAALHTEEERELFVEAAVRHMAEERMQSIADLIPQGDFLEVRGPGGEVVAARASDRDFPWPDTLPEKSFEPVEHRGEPFLTHSTPFEVAGQLYTFYTATPLGPLQAIGDQMRGYLHWAVLLFLGLSTLGGWMIATRALRPVDEITRAARLISIEDLSHRLEVPRTGDELERLASTWNKMLARLEGAVVRLNQFTADASHELRTPTAVIRTTAELALRRERSPEEYRDSLQKIHRESGRMTQLVEDLLTLARADTSLGGMSLTSVSLDLMARDVCYDYQVLAEAKRVDLSWQASDTTPAVAGNEAALRRLLVVLLDNAIKYTHAGGSITVRVKSERGQPVLEVTDTGVGIPSADIPKIFDRFYRADPSRSRATGSFGLGLSVAKWIADRHDATISVESVEGVGSTFRVRFPGPEQSDQPSREATRENPTRIS